MQRQVSITDSFLSHHRCLRGILHLSHGMILLIGIGLIAIIGLFVLELLYFKRGIFVLLIPLCVSLCTIYATLCLKKEWIKPIIGISYFHIFISIYLALIFSYFFFFKPLYIIMVLNWAFDTLYTHKTPSYYIQCFCIYVSIFIFGIFNLWQLMVSQDFCAYVDMLARTEISTTKSQQTAVTSLETINEKHHHNPVVLVVNRNLADPSSLPPPSSGQDYRLVL